MFFFVLKSSKLGTIFLYAYESICLLFILNFANLKTLINYIRPLFLFIDIFQKQRKSRLNNINLLHVRGISMCALQTQSKMNNGPAAFCVRTYYIKYSDIEIEIVKLILNVTLLYHKYTATKHDTDEATQTVALMFIECSECTVRFYMLFCIIHMYIRFTSKINIFLRFR